jgi:2-dehydro-3-deoxyphosphogluconate aldolase / (4S)-4-hydroxy-2-oxoglutarate aldolase
MLAKESNFSEGRFRRTLPGGSGGGDHVLVKLKVLQKIVDSGLVAVVRAESSEQAARIAEACAEGGAAGVEITFTVPGATARAAILAGARFVVSPSLNPETARLCNRYQIPYMPGASTVKEVVEGMEWGADIVKVFPGEALGVAFVKAVRGPLPQASLMPTGGVSLENVGEWIQAGCVAVGVGGSLTAGAKKGDFRSITEMSRQFIAKIRQARGRSH